MPKVESNPTEEKYRDIRNFDSRAQQLRVWIDDDINTRGYDLMTDLEVSQDLFDEKVDVQREQITGMELFEQTDKTELGNLRNGTHSAVTNTAEQQQDDYRTWVRHIADNQKTFIKTGPIVDTLKDIWGNTSQTWANFVDYFQTSSEIDRGTWLQSKIVSEQDVTTARAL